MKNITTPRDFVKSEFKNVFNLLIVGCAALIMAGLFIMFFGNGLFIPAPVSFGISVVIVAAGISILIIGSSVLKHRSRNMRKYFEDLSFGVESTAKAAMLSFKDPMVVVTSSGVIRWNNTAFASLCNKSVLLGTKLADIFPNIRISSFLETDNENHNIEHGFSFNGRDYILIGTPVITVRNNSEETLISLIFSDISAITALQTELDDHRTIVCTAVIDNYDEVLRETPNSSHGALIGDIERCIGLWVEKGEGFYRRYERDKFVILFEAAKFEVLLKEKFSLLSDAKEIDQGNRIPVTLSIGVGASEDGLLENDRVSLVALDMALGRGGDQAVIKGEEGYAFFGARSLGVEKTTKVKARVVADSLCRLTDEASKVIIMGHKSSDYDSFGAAVGLFRAVRSRGKVSYIALDRAHNNIGEILPDMLIDAEYSDGIIALDRAMGMMDDNTLLIIVDTHRPTMVEYPELLERAKNVVLIDHHRRGEDFIENIALVYHEPYASSTCEMVAEILQHMDDTQSISVHEAETLYCGIYLDTKAFTFKTGARTFEAAAYLRRIGVDPVGVHKIFRNDLAMYIQKSRIISNAKVYRDNIAIAICDENTKNAQLVVAQAADDLLDINGIEASFVLASIGNRIVISGRSLGMINVQIILEKLGGGGHITIAGAQLENNSLTIAELKLHNAIDEVLYE